MQRNDEQQRSLEGKLQNMVGKVNDENTYRRVQVLALKKMSAHGTPHPCPHLTFRLHHHLEHDKLIGSNAPKAITANVLSGVGRFGTLDHYKIVRKLTSKKTAHLKTLMPICMNRR